MTRLMCRALFGVSLAVSLVSATGQSTDNGVTLTFTFESRSQRLLISRVYACYPGSPTIETWTRVSSTVRGMECSRPVAVSTSLPSAVL